MRKYYSQHGEDFLLWKVFKEKPRGFFVEVGGLDGIRFSNTYSFELEGWSGVCIEPHPDYYPLLKKNRPHSHCIETAAGKQDGFIEFYAEPRGDFSTIVGEHVADERYQNKMAGYKRVTVPVLCLDKILKDVQAPRPIDFVSIDVEGAEMDVLAGFNLSYYSPRVLIVEANDEKMDAAIDKHMQKHGYFKAGRLSRTNNFYCRNFWDATRIAITPLKCELNIVKHPLHAYPGVDDTSHIQLVDQPSLSAQNISRLFSRVNKRIKSLFGNV